MWSSTVVYGGRRPMGSLIEELGRREAAARAESDRLRARIEELTEELARAEEQVTRLAITREEVTRVLEEPPAADAAPREGGSGGEPGPGSPIGAMTVPPWQEGAEASALPQSYQDLVEVAEDAGRPLRAAEFAVATGQSTEKAKVEGLRSKLKLLAARGWLAGVPGGLFTLEDHAGETQKPGQEGVLLPKFGGASRNRTLRKEEPSGSVCHGPA